MEFWCFLFKYKVNDEYVNRFIIYSLVGKKKLLWNIMYVNIV